MRTDADDLAERGVIGIGEDEFSRAGGDRDELAGGDRGTGNAGVEFCASTGEEIRWRDGEISGEGGQDREPEEEREEEEVFHG